MDFLAKFSRLVNGMGQSLVLSWTKLSKTADLKVSAESLRAVEAKVPLMLQLLIHEDDDISANIVGFCYDYLHVLKQVLYARLIMRLRDDLHINLIFNLVCLCLSASSSQ